ncbi:hypothetical protein OF83DRAFT_1088318, partial [Amylostereum chailletii]
MAPPKKKEVSTTIPKTSKNKKSTSTLLPKPTSIKRVIPLKDMPAPAPVSDDGRVSRNTRQVDYHTLSGKGAHRHSTAEVAAEKALKLQARVDAEEEHEAKLL